MKLSERDYKYLSGLLYNRHDDLEVSLDSLRSREHFSDNQKTILVNTCGKNFFKTKTSIKEYEAEKERIDKINTKLKQQVYEREYDE